ncbi:MAG: hypothetical protein HFE39_05810 [Clostridiales bacterium]|jgi:hypothetical protein|nr:hypothetical protein [Clostridiales bacterium]
MIKRKSMRLATLLSSVVCLVAVAIPASAKICQSHTQGNFSSSTGYSGKVINGGVGNGMYSGYMSAKIQGTYKQTGSATSYNFRGSESANSYFIGATHTANQDVYIAFGMGEFYGSTGGGATYNKILYYD